MGGVQLSLAWEGQPRQFRHRSEIKQERERRKENSIITKLWRFLFYWFCSHLTEISLLISGQRPEGGRRSGGSQTSRLHRSNSQHRGDRPDICSHLTDRHRSACFGFSLTSFSVLLWYQTETPTVVVVIVVVVRFNTMRKNFHCVKFAYAQSANYVLSEMNGKFVSLY